MYKKLVLLVVCSIAMLPCFASQADPAEDLNALMSKLSTLVVDFQLEIRNQTSNDLLDENSGTLTVKRPGFFHVHTKEPFEQILVSDRQVIWTYDVELEQATREPVDERLQQTPFLLLSGDVDAIRQHFSVAEPNKNNSDQQFTLSPKDLNASYDNVALNFDAQGILTAMSWHNSLGESNTLTFSNINVNKPVADDLFHFQPPDGVDVEIKSADTSPQP